MTEATRLIREKEYHNKAFSEGTRKEADKYYAIFEKLYAFAKEAITRNISGKKALEYGCGPGSYAFSLAEAGADVTAIDISDVAIEIVKSIAQEKGLQGNFKVMNAEELEFEDNSFDLICGTAILHHLDLEKAYAEIARTLKQDGRSIFLEPLGHNPIINLYRKLTPAMRTEDEHPLLMNDIRLAKKFFKDVNVHYFHLTTLFAVPFRNTIFFKPLLNIFNTLDKIFFTIIPPMKSWSWYTVIEFRNPIKK